MYHWPVKLIKTEADMPEIEIHHDKNVQSINLFGNKRIDVEELSNIVLNSLNGKLKKRHYSPEVVRFIGAKPFGMKSRNVPRILVNLKLFYRDDLDMLILNRLCTAVSEYIEGIFPGTHTIVEAYAGNLNGFSEKNSP